MLVYALCVQKIHMCVCVKMCAYIRAICMQTVFMCIYMYINIDECVYSKTSGCRCVKDAGSWRPQCLPGKVSVEGHGPRAQAPGPKSSR